MGASERGYTWHRSGDGDAVLLTGATGFVGMEVLARFLERTDRDLYVLVRGADDVEAARRVESALSTLFGDERSYLRRVRAVRGDITREGLGLRDRRRDELAERVAEIVHVAASVEFDLGLERAREVNVEGTRRVLEFAELCQRRAGLRRLSYVSTAYVAGDHSGCFAEEDLEVGQRFRNAYERSKFEAEQLVAGRRERLPITVLRPSIIVGESDTGWTASFNVLYWPLRAFARGTYLALPARREAPVDVVPVDFVADAIFLLSQLQDAEGMTYHLSASPATSSVGEVVELARSRFARPAPRLIAPWAYRRVLHPMLVHSSRDARRRRALERSRLYFPYFAVNVTYDNRRCREILAPAGIHPKPLRDYFDRLVEFALLAQWGRRQVSRAEVARGSSRRLGRDAQGLERVGPVGMHLDTDDQAVAKRELVRH
ncbi:MAG: NAD-dependent epimerase/dehydratase family protein [Actinobacteria bacterium]|nr:MAG: NAD-dependent epimerase/dehydratase family protein [Actinomycetota bacterium]